MIVDAFDPFLEPSFCIYSRRIAELDPRAPWPLTVRARSQAARAALEEVIPFRHFLSAVWGSRSAFQMAEKLGVSVYDVNWRLRTLNDDEWDAVQSAATVDPARFAREL